MRRHLVRRTAGATTALALCLAALPGCGQDDRPDAKADLARRTALGADPRAAETPLPRVTAAQVQVAPDFRRARTVDADCRAALAHPAGVLLLGDSLTVGAARELTAGLASAGIPVCLDAVVGRNAEEGNAVLRTFVASGRLSNRTTVVMAFGANDADRGESWGTCQATTALAAVGPDARVLWVNGFNASTDEAVAGQERFNREVAGVAGETSRLGIIDWHAAALAGTGLISGDAVHPTPKGRTEWSRLLTRGILAAPTSVHPGDQVAPRCPAPTTR